MLSRRARHGAKPLEPKNCPQELPGGIGQDLSDP